MLGACSWLPFGDSEEKEEEKLQKEATALSEEQLYERIQRNLNAGNWTDAITNLQAFEAQFPFGNYAEQAQLELIYVYHSSLDHQAAIAAADRFIRLHPRHPNVDYAYYIKGLSSILESKGLFAERIPTDQSKRDPGGARAAFVTFSDLLSRYPDSSYAADARLRMLELRERLARHEIHVANYYFKRGAYLAAANRGRYVIENFQGTAAVPDGLAVMAEAYYLLDMHQLADRAAETLALNYATHPSLDEQGQFHYISEADMRRTDSWFSKLSFGYFVPERPPVFDSRPVYDPTYKIRGETRPTKASGKRGSWLSTFSFGLFGREEQPAE